MSTITSANSIISASIPDVYPAAQQLQGYAVDDAWAAESVEMALAQMGVDGLMSAGFDGLQALSRWQEGLGARAVRGHVRERRCGQCVGS